ncbi:MAG: class I SAM-dependent methyltransferase [Polyangiaceae bacterium]
MTDAGRVAARFFDAIAGRYERVYALPSADSRARMQKVVASLPPAPGAVLVLGVGTGRELTALLDAGYAPTGLDVSRAMIERGARRARPVPVVEGDFWESPLPFDGGTFAGAVALHGTLAHPPDVAAVGRLAKDLARVVVPGGRLVIETPSLSWLERLPTSYGESTEDGERRLRRTGPATLVYEDLVVGGGIEARLLSEGEWRDALAPGWTVAIEPLGRAELFLRACRVPAR